jgi:hypothetical protein
MPAQTSQQGSLKETKKYEVAVYYFPNYHIDSINEKWHGKDWTEWDLVKSAKPRFSGHQQPKVPAWGYFNEADPKWAAKEINLAADNGIDVFLYDWYWYTATGPYLKDGLEKGFLKAPNRNHIKFALMWANHDWYNIHPATYTNNVEKLTEGEVSWGLWDTISTYIVKNYFTQPNYWKIDGKPFFCIYEIVTFINGLGSMQKAKDAIQLLDKKTKDAGMPGIHLDIMSWQATDGAVKSINVPDAPKDPGEMMKDLSTNSVFTYCYVHHFDINGNGGPTVPYVKALNSNISFWNYFSKKYPDIIYSPNVSMGWDPSPRCIQSEKWSVHGYPWTAVLTGNTPNAFKDALVKAKEFLDVYNPPHKIVTINAWNEWTEGSYLLPDTKTGDAYLREIKKVFGQK